MDKNTYTNLWSSFDDISNEILKRYQEQKKLSDDSYKDSVDKAKKLYDSQRDEAASAYRVTKLNTDAKLASQGLENSGESIQRDLMNNLVRGESMSKAADRYGSTVKELGLEKAKSDLNTDKAYLSEMKDIANEAMENEYRQKKEEREAEQAKKRLELEEKEYQLNKQKVENDIRLKNYQSQKALDELTANYKDRIAALEEALNGEGLYTLDISANETYKRILSQARYSATTGWNTAEGAEYANNVRKSIEAVINDPDVDPTFKKQLTLYARMDGYID